MISGWRIRQRCSAAVSTAMLPLEGWRHVRNKPTHWTVLEITQPNGGIYARTGDKANFVQSYIALKVTWSECVMVCRAENIDCWRVRVRWQQRSWTFVRALQRLTCKTVNWAVAIFFLEYLCFDQQQFFLHKQPRQWNLVAKRKPVHATDYALVSLK